MFKGNEKDYFGAGVGEEKKPAMPEKKPVGGEPDADDKPVATITVHKRPGGMVFKHDEGDGLPPDEHGSIEELAKSLEQKYGEGPTEEAEEKVSPGVHKKAGDYLSHMIDKGE